MPCFVPAHADPRDFNLNTALKTQESEVSHGAAQSAIIRHDRLWVTSDDADTKKMIVECDQQIRSMPIKAFVEIHREAFQMAQRVCESPDYDGTGRIMWDGGSYAGELVKLLAQAKLSEAERERMAAEAEAEKKKTAERTAARLAAQTARAEKKKADAEKKKVDVS